MRTRQSWFARQTFRYMVSRTMMRSLRPDFCRLNRQILRLKNESAHRLCHEATRTIDLRKALPLPHGYAKCGYGFVARNAFQRLGEAVSSFKACGCSRIENQKRIGILKLKIDRRGRKNSAPQRERLLRVQALQGRCADDG